MLNHPRPPSFRPVAPTSSALGGIADAVAKCARTGKSRVEGSEDRSRMALPTFTAHRDLASCIHRKAMARKLFHQYFTGAVYCRRALLPGLGVGFPLRWLDGACDCGAVLSSRRGGSKQPRTLHRTAKNPSDTIPNDGPVELFPSRAADVRKLLRFGQDLGRCLVGPQTAPTWMAQASVAGPFAEPDLADQLRLDERHTLGVLSGKRCIKRRFVGA
jgi:hypothetical protein